MPNRQFTPQSYHSRRKRRRAERTETKRAKLPSGFRLLTDSYRLVANHWEVFGGILLLYGLLNLMLVGGLKGIGDLQNLKDSLNSIASGQANQWSTGLALFTFLVANGTGTTASGLASAYQAVALLIVSLALIWSCRQLYAGQ